MAKQHDNGQNIGTAIAVPERPSGEITVISKVKLGKHIEINCCAIDPKFPIELKEIKFSSSDKPVEEFVESLNAFLSELIFFAGLDEEIWEGGEIIGISFTQTENEPGITISGKCKVGDAGLVACVTTPYITPSVLDEYSPGIGSKIENLQREAIAYIRGERKIKQLELLEASNPIRGVIGA